MTEIETLKREIDYLVREVRFLNKKVVVLDKTVDDLETRLLLLNKEKDKEVMA